MTAHPSRTMIVTDNGFKNYIGWLPSTVDLLVYQYKGGPLQVTSRVKPKPVPQPPLGPPPFKPSVTGCKKKNIIDSEYI
jgi:hypothetical protein